jgi:GntR family transcriptional regulator
MPQLLDKTSPIPLYYQLYLRLRSDIQSGMLRPGDLVGTEKDIQQRYAVSRATVRKALDELGRAGQLVRITGWGTFVAEPALSLHLPHLLSLTEELHHRGVVPGGRVLAFERIAAPGDAAEALRSRPGETTLYIRRLRTGDDIPIVLVDHYLAPSIKLKREDLGESLYSTLEGVLGIRLQEAYHTVRAASSTPEEAHMLAIQPGEAVLRFTRTTLNGQGLPVVYEIGSGRGDLYDYSVHLFRQ